MAIMSTVNRAKEVEPTEPPVGIPFLWRNKYGVIYLRAVTMHSYNESHIIDIIIGGSASLTSIGQIYAGYETSDETWRQRLRDEEGVTLRNFGGK